MSQNTQLGVQVVADIADFTKQFDTMKAQLNALGQTTQESGEKSASGLAGVRKEIESIGTMLKSGMLIEGGKLITQMVTAPLIGLGKEAVLLADNLKKSETAFTVMLGSGDQARAMLKDLQQFAATTPFEFPDLIQAAKKMLALGFGAKEIIPMLKTVGDAAAGLGGGAELMGRITLALGQMNAKGKVSAEEMKQMAEAGIPAWQLLADKIGVTVPEAMAMAKQGAIDGATGVTAIMEGMSLKFGGLMVEQSKTIQGTLANLKDTIGFIMTDIGRQLIDMLQLREVLGSIQTFAQGALTWFRSLDDGTKKTVIALTGAFALAGPILVAVGAFMAAIAVVTAPMLVTGAIITGIVAGGALLIAHWNTIKTTATTIWTAITGTIQTWGTTVNKTIDTAIFGTVALFKSLKDQSIKFVSDMVTEIGGWLGAKLTAIFDKMRAPIETATAWFAKMYDAVVGHSYVPDMVEEIGQHMSKLDHNLTAPARNAAISVGNSFRGIGVTADDVFRTLLDRMAYFSGSAIQTVSNTLAQGVTGMANWKQAGEQILDSFLTTFINAALSMTTSWLIAEATRTSATETANATIAASGAVTSTGLTAVFSAAGMAIKSVMIGLAQGVVSIIGVVISGITTVLDGISFVLSFALQAIAEMIFAAAAAVQSIPIVGQILGAIMIGAGILVEAAAVALPALIAGVGGLLSAGVGALAGAIPAFATGGAVFGPTLALVGENASRGNPEYIGHANQLGLNQGGARQTIIIQLDGRTLAEVAMSHMPGVYKLAMGNR